MADMADRDGWIWLDGELVAWRSAVLHVLSHGLHYASSVFEGERSYNGQVFKLTEHSDRLRASATILGFDMPVGVNEMDEATRLVVDANCIVDGYVRPIAWRGSEALSVSPRGCSVHVAVAAWPWPHVFSPDAAARGVRLRMSRWSRPAPQTAPTQAKASALYQISALARAEAERAGYEDALLLDYRGLLADASGANLFLVIDGALHTPTTECVLDGITRHVVVDCARALGFEVYERELEPSELADAQEVFLTGTAYELQPVCGIDQRMFAVGPVSRALQAAYADLVNSPMASGAA